MRAGIFFLHIDFSSEMADKEADWLNMALISNPIPQRSFYSTEKEEECKKKKKKSVVRDQKVMRAVMRNKELFSSGLSAFMNLFILARQQNTQ